MSPPEIEFSEEFSNTVDRLRAGTALPPDESPPAENPVSLSEAECKQRIHWLAERIPDGASVLDLGCGPGEILHHLKRLRNVSELGLERETKYLKRCGELGVRALRADFNNLEDSHLLHACGQKWDVVLAMDTLFYWHCPAAILAALADRCDKFFISVGNIGQLKIRMAQLRGEQIFWPNSVGNRFTPEINLHTWTINGFVHWAGQLGYEVRPVARRSISAVFKPLGILPGLFSRFVVYELTPRQ